MPSAQKKDMDIMASIQTPEAGTCTLLSHMVCNSRLQLDTSTEKKALNSKTDEKVTHYFNTSNKEDIIAGDMVLISSDHHASSLLSRWPDTIS